MVQLNIQIDESLKAFADDLVAKGRARSVDEVVSSLLAEARIREAEDDDGIPVSPAVEARLLQAIDEPGTPMTDQDWATIRETVRQQHATRNGRS